MLGPENRKEKLQGVRLGVGGEEVEGERWDTEMGTGAEGKDRRKE